MGSCLAIFDWMFGTLHIPAKERERLTYGVDGMANPHAVGEGLVMPVVRAFGHLVPARIRAAIARPAAPAPTAAQPGAAPTP